jgi:hypothetical protein
MTTAPAQPPPLPKALPEPIVKKLEAVIRRIRRVMLLRGLLGLAAATLATLLTLMAVDAAVMLFSEAARWLLTLGGLTVIVLAAAWFISRPLRWKISLAAIAQVVETQHPELQERISSTVELRGLTGSGEGGPATFSAGSEELIAALAEEATLEAGHVDPRKEVSTRSARPFLLAAAALAGLLGLIFAIWPQHASVVLARVVAPGMNLGNVYSVNLRIQPGNRTVALGDAVTVEASAAGPQDLSDVVLETIDATGHVGRQKAPPATVSPDQAVVAWNFPAVMSGFRYRVHAGRALSEYYRIDAVPRPQVQSIEVRYDYPAYTALKPRTFKELPALVEAVVGTRVTMAATMTQPIARWQVQLNGKPWESNPVGNALRGVPGSGNDALPQPAERHAARSLQSVSQGVPQGTTGGLPTRTSAGDDWHIVRDAKGQPEKVVSWSFSLEPDTAGHVSVAMEDPHAISCDPLGFEVRAVPDGPPTIAIVDPKESKLTRKPQDRLTIAYEAQDDFGLSAIEMLVRLDAGEPTVMAQPFPAGVEPPLCACRGEAVLDLGQLDLRQARQVTVVMRVRDTLPESLHGPHQANSRPLVIEIDHSGEQPVAEMDPAEAARAAALAKEAQEIRQMAQEQQQVAGQAQQAEQAAEKADPQAAAQSPDAPWQKEQEKLAKEMANEVKKDPQALENELKSDQKQARDLAADAQKLTDEEKWLQQQSQALADAQTDREKLKQAILDRLAQEQKRLAEQAGQLQAQMKAADQNKSDPANAEQAKADEAKADQVAAAQQEMKKSADDLTEHNAADAAQQAHEAEKQLQASAPSEPLTAAEKNVAEALDDVNKGALDAALEKVQQEVQQQSQQVKAEAQDLAARAEAVHPDPQAQQAAQQAADQLAEAGKESQQAEQSLAQAQQAADQAQASADKPQAAAQAKAAASQADKAAGQAQARAAEALQQAAGDLRKLGDELGRQADAAQQTLAQGSPEEKSLASALDKAMQSANQSAQAPDKAQAAADSAKAAHDASQAAQAAQRAAQAAEAQAIAHGKARAAARQAQTGGKPGNLPATMPAAAGSKMNQVAATPAAASVDSDPAKLKQSDKPETDWAKFQGKVNRAAQDDHAKNTPEEYRDLVNRYFEELARQGGRPEGKGK